MSKYNKSGSLFENVPENLRHLIRHADHLQQLTLEVQKFLGEPLGRHIQIANFTNEKLVLIADNAAWATRMRYQMDPLSGFLRKISKQEIPLNIQLIVRPQSPEAIKKHTAITPISMQSSETLKETALTIDDDALKQAMLRLSRHQK